MRTTRRNFLFASAALAGCRPPLAKPFNGYAFVANREGRTVAAVNLSKFQVSKQISLDSEPAAVLVAPGTQRVFVLTPDNATVVEIDGNTLALVRKKRVGARASSMRLAPDGASLWLMCIDPQALIRLDLKSWRTETNIKLTKAVRDFDLSASAPLGAIDNPPSIVNLAAGRIERPLDIDAIDGEIGVIRFRPDGKQILAGLGSSRMIAIADTTTGRLQVKLPLAIEPERFCFTTDNGGQMFVSGRGMDAIVIVSPYQNVVDQTILAGRAPGAMTVDANMVYVFVANPESGDLSVIEIQDRRMTAKIAVGQKPNQILITPDNQYALVLNERSDDMAVVRVSKLADDVRRKRAPLFTVIPVGEKPVNAAICSL